MALLLAFALPAAALGQCPKTNLADIEDEVMCPVCGTTLQLATEAPQANRQRELIRREVDSCRSKDEVKARLVAEFGPDVLAVPEDEGFGLSAYLVPIILFVAALLAIAFSATRWRRRRPAAAGGGAGPGLSPGDSDRLDRDMERYD